MKSALEVLDGGSRRNCDAAPMKDVMMRRLQSVYLVMGMLGAGVRAQTGEVARDERMAVSIAAADALRMRGAYTEAIGAYAELFLSDETEVAAACGVALCFVETGKYEAAIEALASVSDRGDGSGLWHRSSAAAWSSIGRYTAARAHLTRAIELNAKDYEARRRLGQLFERIGARDRAIDAYKYFNDRLTQTMPADAAALTSIGEGVLRYSVLTRHPKVDAHIKFVLQDFYQRAYTRVDRGYWPARIAAADLLRSKSKYEEAAADYLTALNINPNLAVAHLGLGWIAQSTWDFDEVEHRLELARAINPQSTEAHRLEAALRLTERRYAEAERAAQAALGINPNDVAALGYAAAAAHCLNKPRTVGALLGRAYQVSSRPATYHRIMGDVLGGLRQYEASEREYLSAIEADGTDPATRAELGLMYMQWGEEEKAHAALTAAWQLDRFDARTFNTLSLLESIEKFARYESPNFVIRFDPTMDAVLAPYMADYLEEIHDELCEDYATSLTEKTVIEVFPSHRAFGVRITGKPWIHTVGACTGKVIAMESPRDHAQLQGKYNYAQVLRHEYTHTVTLAATENRIPHWFTEGLAVMQEDAPRSFEWCVMLANAVRRDELFTLETIDWAFMRPQRPNDRQIAYAQSEWMCAFIVERFGYGAINEMILGYRDRGTQETVLKKVSGLTIEEFDAAFRRWARDDAAEWGLPLEKPESVSELRMLADEPRDDADTLARLARAEFDAGDIVRAVTAARRAVEIDPLHKDGLTVLGETLWMVRESGDDADARRQFDAELTEPMKRLLTVDTGGWIAPKVLGTIALERQEYDAALEHFQTLKRTLPIDPASDRTLAGIFLGRGDVDRALPYLLETARVTEDDPELALTLGSIFETKSRLGEARHWYRQALYVDPFRPEIHASLATVCERLGKTGELRRELDALCKLEPNIVRHFERAARAFDESGDAVAARRFAQRAVELDPETSVRNLANETP